MICKVCSKEIKSRKYGTIGNQVVCSLSCVGLLVSNEEDKCDQCQRPVWKDNYYIFNSKYYCCEKCKLTAVKRFLKRNSNLTSVNIEHIQSEHLKNDTPTVGLQELRKEVKELYDDFEFEENNSPIKQIPSSYENKSLKSLNGDKNINEMKETTDTYYIEEATPENDGPVPNEKSFKNFNNLPNRVSSIKLLDNTKNNKYPHQISKEKIMRSYTRTRNNYSLDNHNRSLNTNYNVNNMPQLKYSYNQNNSMFDYNKKMKLKPTYLNLKLQGPQKKMKNKLSKKLIPNPNLINFDRNNSRYHDSLENNENENYGNIPYPIVNNCKKDKTMYNTNQNFVENYDNYKYYESIHNNKERKVILYDSKY